MNNLYCYIHIPFCENRCKYCRFASFGISEEEKIDKYVDYLVDEIKFPPPNLPLAGEEYENFPLLLGRGLGGGGILKTIYFGGGTPSTLNLDQLSKIILTLKQKFIFDDNIEITLESTPNKITKNNLIGWQKLGINRLSIGVQTLNNDSLKEIGRGEKGDIIEALDLIKNTSPLATLKTTSPPAPLLRGEGSKLDLSLDFIIGLPHVKLGEIKNNIKLILDKYDFVNHISVYMLEDQYYPDSWKNLGISEEDYLGEYIDIKEFLKSRGFYSYEISNFAKLGFECKHNKAYWNHNEILAFGLGAHGYINGYRYENHNNFGKYYDTRIKTNEKLNENDIFLEKVMFGLRTGGLEKNIYDKLDKIKIDYFIENGYLKIENEILKVEDKGILVMDYILGEII